MCPGARDNLAADGSGKLFAIGLAEVRDIEGLRRCVDAVVGPDQAVRHDIIEIEVVLT